MKPVCIVMAAGVGKRFGANKLLADFAGKPLYRWALDAIDGSCFSAVIVVTGYEPVAAAAEELGFRVICNDCPEDGVSRTIRLGLQAAGFCSGALFMTADQPLLSEETLRQLTERFCEESQYIYAAAHDGVRGNPCLFPQAYFAELCALQGDTGGAAVIRKHPERLRLMEVPEWELFDCDTPETMAICREKAEEKYQNYAKNCLTSI